MSCNITRGKAELACKDSVGGLKSIYIANYDDYDMTAVVGGTASGNPEMLLTDLGSLAEVYKYNLKNTGNVFDQTITSDRNNGVTLYDQVLTFILTKITAAMEYQVRMMALGRPIIFVETNHGKIFVIGLEHGAEISGTTATGGEMNSLNGYTLTATAQEREPIFYLDDATVTALKALVSVENLD